MHGRQPAVSGRDSRTARQPCNREFTKGGFVKGALAVLCVNIMLLLPNPLFTKPPFVNSRYILYYNYYAKPPFADSRTRQPGADKSSSRLPPHPRAAPSPETC